MNSSLQWREQHEEKPESFRELTVVFSFVSGFPISPHALSLLVHGRQAQAALLAVVHDENEQIGNCRPLLEVAETVSAWTSTKPVLSWREVQKSTGLDSYIT